MTLIDRVILRRLGSRIAITIVVLYGLILLAESLNVWRFQHLSSIGGPWLGLLAIVVEAFRWALATLPVTLLIGAIIGILDLQARRELTVIKATGLSIWRILRVPAIAVIILGVIAALAGDTIVVLVSRSLTLTMPQVSSSDSALWLEQRGGGQRYVMVADHPHPGGTVLEDVTIFLDPDADGGRIEAKLVELREGAWLIADGVRFQPDSPPQTIEGVSLPTTSTAADMGVNLASPVVVTSFELAEGMSMRVTVPDLRNGVEMRLLRLVALPLALVGSLLIALAFTTGYRRTNKYGAAVLYGVVLGFVVYVITEMAAMAGAAGVLEPAFAAFAPAFVAVVIGTTVLLFREDGRT
jgi:lipopolysaccharide export system permease protein